MKQTNKSSEILHIYVYVNLRPNKRHVDPTDIVSHLYVIFIVILNLNLSIFSLKSKITSSLFHH